MVTRHQTARHTISDDFIEEVCSRLAENKRVRRTLPEGGRLHIDRQLPFLCVYRHPLDRSDPETQRLVTGEPSFLIAPGGAPFRKSLSALVRRLAETLVRPFGALLIVEVWSAPQGRAVSGYPGMPYPPPPWGASADAAPADRAAGCSSGPADGRPPGTAFNGDAATERPLPQGQPVTAEVLGSAPMALRPAFKIAARGPHPPRATIDTLAKVLRRIKIFKQPADVELSEREYGRPPGMPPLISIAAAQQIGCRIVGLQVRPVYRDSAAGEVFPATLRMLRRGLSRALKQAFFTFAQTHTSVRPQHYYALGRRSMVKAVWEVDRRLAEIGDTFDFLLQATPINAETAWREFRRGLFQKPPVFLYRPLAVEPSLLKRRLYEIPIERIEDPTLGHLLAERQDELDRKITMLSDVGSPRFLLGSLQVYGNIEPMLLKLANQLLRTIPARSREPSGGKQIDAKAFADHALAEIAYYRRQYPEFRANVVIRDDMYWGLLVSGGDLLIGRHTRVPAGRVEALLQHEIGTHLVTYYNGRAQPFRQLYSGLAGCDALQEGLAVLAEYLAEGLSRPRLRLLAGRVAAAQQVIQGASFIDTFRLLRQTHGFPQRTAYTVTMRAYRGGGLTKDVVYLRGLVEILDYLRGGGELEPLLVGKIAADHIPLVRELHLRRILRPPPLRPRYLENLRDSDKLRLLRNGLSVQQLVEGRQR